jgi:hypothetical protein
MTAIPHMDDTSVDAAVPWHFGEPFKEQRELVAGRGRVDLSHRGVVTVTGPIANLGCIPSLLKILNLQLRI